MAIPKFPFPKSSLVIDESLDFSSFSSDIFKKSLNDHYFNQTLQLMFVNVPNNLNANLTPNLNKLLNEEKNGEYQFYLIKNLPVHCLLNKVFIENYIKNGQVFALSINTSIQTDNCFSFTPNGKLILSVVERTYQQLGLEGKKSILYRKKNVLPKYLIEIDTKSFNYEQKIYNRVYTQLKNGYLIFDLLLKYIPNTEKSSNIFNYFKLLKDNPVECGDFLDETDSKAIEINVCSPNIRKFNQEKVLIPNKYPLNSEIQFDESIYYDFIEWIGGHFSHIVFSHSNDSKFVQINKFEIGGLFTPKDVNCLIEELKQMITSKKDKNLNIIMIVNGFEESVISWDGKNNEHGKNVSGENLIGILLRNNGSCLVWRCSDEYDYGIEKL